MSKITFSCVIPCKDPKTAPYLPDLIKSIKSQDFPQDQIEILVMGPEHGDSEQAKGAGIKLAQGEIIGMFCADNMLTDKSTFSLVKKWMDMRPDASAFFPRHYAYRKDDNSLNRYFSLIGGNDPICYYLGKNDRWPHVDSLKRRSSYQPSYGCNGFFYRAHDIKRTNLSNYYPMDNAMEVSGIFLNMSGLDVWHRTSDNLLTFLRKRYRYARDLYCDRQDRRWKMLDGREDYWKLSWFILSTITILPSVLISIRGYWKIRDFAWFWHWPVCLGFLITYGLLTFRNLFKHGRLFQCPQPA